MSDDGLPPVCILAGGLGTRLGSLVADTPKPLLEVAGRPFLSHLLEELARQGTTRVVLCVGYLGAKIAAAIGSTQFGISIDYSDEGREPIGTLGAVRRALPLLGPEFLVQYGDTYLQLDYARAVGEWRESELPAMMTVLENADRWGPSNAVYRHGRVVAYDKEHRTPDMRWIDYGVGGLTADVALAEGRPYADLSALQHVLAARGKLCGVEVRERFYEIGTASALEETEAVLIARRRGTAVPASELKDEPSRRNRRDLDVGEQLPQQPLDGFGRQLERWWVFHPPRGCNGAQEGK